MTELHAHRHALKRHMFLETCDRQGLQLRNQDRVCMLTCVNASGMVAHSDCSISFGRLKSLWRNVTHRAYDCEFKLFSFHRDHMDEISGLMLVVGSPFRESAVHSSCKASELQEEGRRKAYDL